MKYSTENYNLIQSEINERTSVFMDKCIGRVGQKLNMMGGKEMCNRRFSMTLFTVANAEENEAFNNYSKSRL